MRRLLAEVNEPVLSQSQSVEEVAVVGQQMHSRFEGQSDYSAFKKNILTNVLVPGDISFSSGDLLYPALTIDDGMVYGMVCEIYFYSIYVYDLKAGQLVDLTESVHDEIISCVIKL